MTGNLNETVQPIRLEKAMIYNELYDRICVFISLDKPIFTYNHMIKERIAKSAASVQYLLEHEKLRLAMSYKKSADFVRLPEMDDVYGRIDDLTSELHNLMIMMTTSAKMDVSDKERRCVFHKFGNTKETNLLLHFIRLYNTWTSRSAEYLVMEARQKHDDEKFRQHIDKTGDTTMRSRIEEARANVTAEYDRKLNNLRTLLSDYVNDLHNIANKLNEEYGLLEQLENMNEFPDDSNF